jgi:hypothetical protein
MLAVFAASFVAVVAPPAMNADGWAASDRTPQSMEAATKAIERAEAACRALADAVITETTAAHSSTDSVRWESRAAARAWTVRVQGGIEVVGLDDTAFVTADALPGQMALVECATGCRESFAEAGIVLPVMASVRLGSSLADVLWKDELPDAVVAGSRTTEAGTEVLLIDAAGGGDVLVQFDGASGLPARVRAVRRLPEAISHPALKAAPVLEWSWTGKVRDVGTKPAAISVPNRTMAASLKALLDQLDPAPRRLPAELEPRP